MQVIAAHRKQQQQLCDCVIALTVSGVNCAAGRVFVPAVECKQLVRKERVQKRHFRIRKKVSSAVWLSWQQSGAAAVLLWNGIYALQLFVS